MTAKAITGQHLTLLQRLFGPGQTTARDSRHWMRGNEVDRARLRTNGAKVIER